jgi:hypothetical protein
MYSDFLEKTDAVTAILPVSSTSASAINGVAIDRTGYLSAGVCLTVGINPSVPTGFTTLIKVQHSLTSTSGDFVDFAAIETFGSAADLTAASVTKYYNVNLRGARKYIRVVVVNTFTGGSSPSSLFGAVVVLGDKNVEPANSSTVYGS